MFLASRSVYDQMLSRYKRIGQLNYFDIRNTKRIKGEDGVTEDNIKWIAVTATVKRK